MQESLFEQIIASSLEVHQVLQGPGLMENIYESALYHELVSRKISYQRQVPVPVLYKGAAVRGPLFLDLLVENQLVVEIKAQGADNPFYQIQLLTYLRLLGVRHGLLINFGKVNLREGICRVMNDRM